MGSLSEILGGGDYKSIIGHIDELDSIYQELLDLIPINEVNFDNEPDEDGIRHIRRFWDDCDERIKQSHLSDSYLSEVKLIQNALYDEFGDKKTWRDEGFAALAEWILEIDRPQYLFELLYVHQRMMQLRYILMMYDAGGDENATLARNLFEAGLLQHNVDQNRYMRLVFSDRHHNFMRRHSFWHAHFFLIRRQQQLPKIKWIDISSLTVERQAELFEGVKLAHLAYRDHPTKGVLSECLTPIKLCVTNNLCIEGRFHLDKNLNGYVGMDENGNVVLGFSGTEKDSWDNWKTDARQYFGYLDPVYVNAAKILDALWQEKCNSGELKDVEIKVYGHSLGGGLMQYAIAKLQQDDVEGYGYNSAGLSRCNTRRVGSKMNLKILHLYRPCDIVFKAPFAYQLGESISCGTKELNPQKAHGMESIRKAIDAKYDTIAFIKGERVG